MLFGMKAEKVLLLIVLVLGSSRIRKLRACAATGPCRFDFETRVPWDNHYVDNRDNINCRPYEDCYIANGESFTVRDGVCRIRDADLPIVVNDSDQPGSEQKLVGDTEFECVNGALAATGGINVANVQSIKGCADSCVLTLDQLVNQISYGQCMGVACPICVKDRDGTPVDASNICLGRQIEFITHTGKTVLTSDDFVVASDTLTVECETSPFNEFHTNKITFNGQERRDIIAIRCVQSGADCPFTFNTPFPWDDEFVNPLNNVACIRGNHCFIQNGQSITIDEGVCRLRDAELPIVIDGNDQPGSEQQLVGDTVVQCTNGVLTATNNDNNFGFTDNQVDSITGCADACVMTMDGLLADLGYGTCDATFADGQCLQARDGNAVTINVGAICATMLEFIDHTTATLFTSDNLNGDETLTIECQNSPANEFRVNSVVYTDANSATMALQAFSSAEIAGIHCV